MSQLFTPFTLRGLTIRNRTVIAPMCQYTSQHGFANDWHFVHLGRFALGGFGLVILEATGVTPEARISYGDLGLWDDEHIAPLAHIVQFLKAEGSATGIQLAHAGRKAATPIAWRHGFDETEAEKAEYAYETWIPEAPSAERHSDNPAFQMPVELDKAGIHRLVQSFADAARRADQAGFDTVEIHGAHGYLINQFLSPLANHRTDEYGGSRENRMRFALEVTEAVRAAWPEEKPLLMRLSVTDGSPGGWSIDDTIALSLELKSLGVDMIHCSSGGFDGYSLKSAPLYQVQLSKAVRAAGIPTIAVGLIDDPYDAERILESGEADLVAFARTALEDPNWAIHARHILEGGGDAYQLWPKQARNRIRDRDRVLGIRQ
ncbi:NADH:flavin oxidoreductase/NADH oxidase [Devosia sp. ZB163]|uniref:NADH:flavin oxidoreductase/NADH oxidase n=1 Tax=Devosia sp. ZB163 TaxID=3025938 RepID=UPI00235F3E1A|nr:NADH:flavin oxidoreductase/NADH oxidase [Devosia sp. ZB163]MDC9825950.1 NADH:flavin oxidoreductase/NADH oxidase [Devosia sp. ZB163]